MAGSLVDVARPEVVLPERLVVDSTIVVGRLPGEGSVIADGASAAIEQERAIRFVTRLRDEGAPGVMTSTGSQEIFHVILKPGYRRALTDHRADLADRYPNVKRHGWEHLFKARSDLVKRFAGVMDEARRLTLPAGSVSLQPDDVGLIPSGRTQEDELLLTRDRYEIDSSDAAILIETRRVGVDVVASADRDLHRARLDFDVYAWP